MTTRMLIDARHQEETRVAVLKGNRIEEFDFESSDKKQIKGNIYLAKVTRVEPSLQAAFVDFGGNRHGFLAFSEIHPDYYQIPREDREALLAAEAEAAEEEARLREEEEARGEMPGDEYDADDESAGQFAEEMAEDGVEEVDTSEKDDVATIEEGHYEHDADDEHDDRDDDEHDADRDDDHGHPGDRRGHDGEDRSGRDAEDGRRRRGRRQGKGTRTRAKEVDDARARRMALRRRYKIQDVIQRRQVLLVQVVKEERGNKGAALTTYLSLAGRYCVLMPNSGHGGGISRKISSAGDRKRLKSIVEEMSLPKSMGLIVRTAGLQRTKTEIRRDFDYLARLWDEIRENTLTSSAPALIHSDSDLIKRAIRDIYNREIEEVVVEGGDGYKSARDFMKMLMPSHARRVKPYSDPVPLFQRYGAEDQLKAMYDPVVQLKSGGYLVINPTEALVSIDINSGRSTKEHGIEQTALATNLEAAREIARQLRLRDMAGLVVIDFIDMEQHSNTRKVEKAMKEALKNDRARIQVGRISSFGLMEMSRQRLRTGVLEATTRQCPHCDGTGLVRTASSAGLSALRLIEEEAARGRGTIITLSASREAAIYLLNAKRAELMEIEDRYGVEVEVVPDGENEGAKMEIASSGPRPTVTPRFEPIVEEIEDEDDLAEDSDGIEDEDDADEESRDRTDGERSEGRGGSRDRDDDGENGERGRKRRRRRGGRNRRRDRDGEDGETGSDQGEDGEREDAPQRDEDDADRAAEDRDSEDRPSGDGEDEIREGEDRDGEDGERAGRKRRRRGGRGRRAGRDRDDDRAADGSGPGDGADRAASDGDGDTGGEAPGESAEGVPGAEDLARRIGADMAVIAGPTDSPQTAEAVVAADRDAEADGDAKPAAKPRRGRRRKADAEPAPEAETATTEVATPVGEDPVSEDPVSNDDAAAPAAKPRRSRRKKTDEAPAETGEAESEAVAPAPAKPRRSRRKAVADAPGDAAHSAAAAQNPELVDTPIADRDPQEAGEATPRPSDPAPGTDSAADNDAAPANAAAPAAKQRRGWWQRTFGE